MSRVKGRGNRKWTAQEKLDIVRRYLESGVERHRFASAEGIASGMLYTWVKRYQEQGEKGLKNKKKTGNPYAALHTSKSLGKLERLELTVAKQKVEIARLKNGYQVRGGGQSKVFVTLNGASTNSSLHADILLSTSA